jgi:hypothetical protein
MKKLIIPLALATFFAGALWYAFHSQIIIFSFPALAEYSFQQAQEKTISLYWFKDHQKITEKNDIIWPSSMPENITAVISAWLALAQEENLIDRRVKLQHVSLTANKNELFVSFSHTLFGHHLSIIKKWESIEGLLLTLKPLFPEMCWIRFLVQDAPLNDDHIDFSASLPVAPFLSIFNPVGSTAVHNQGVSAIVIHPFGDKTVTGKIIAQEFERKIMRQMAVKIKEMLESTGKFRVYITHEIGQPSDREQNATFANRLAADLYIDLVGFESKKVVSEIQCFFPLYDPATDFWAKKRDTLSLTPIHKAFLKNCNRSLTACSQFSKNLKQCSEQRMIINPYFGLPLRRWVGIEVPSMVIECGMQKPEQVTQIACVIAQALEKTIF